MLAILLATAWALSDSEMRLAEPSEKVQAQLQEWEGKTTGCWIEAVRALRDGCNEGELLKEEDRKRLAFVFASCQLQEDGIEPQKDPTEMATRARDGYPLVYQIYTEYLVNVEVICNTLSQRIFQKETRNAMHALKEASVTHLRELQSLKTSMNNIRTMATIIRTELENNQIEMSGKFLAMFEEQDKLSAELERHSAAVDDQFSNLDSQIISGQNKLSELKDQTTNVSVMLMSVETSATAIRENQEVFHYYWYKADDLLNLLNQGVSSVATLMFITATCLLSYVCTTPVRTRSARFPMLITCVMCTLSESLIFYAYEHSSLLVLEKTWMARKLFVVIGLACLLDAAVRYVEPEVQFVRKLNEFESRFFDRVKRDIRERTRAPSIEPAPERRAISEGRLREIESSVFQRVIGEFQQRMRSLSRGRLTATTTITTTTAKRLPSVIPDDDTVTESDNERCPSLPPQDVGDIIESTPDVIEPSEAREPSPERVIKQEPIAPVLPVSWTPSSFSYNYSSYRQHRSPSYESMRGLSLSSEGYHTARSGHSHSRNYSESPEPSRAVNANNPLSNIDVYPIDSSGRSVFDW